ncbi:MAG: methyl-accepting chemotaxis protein [Cyanobacteria bacterium J06582_2]
MTNFAHYRDLELVSESELTGKSVQSASWWQRQSIRFKTTLLAIAIGTIPTLAVGSVAYYFAANSLIQESTSQSETLVRDLQNQVNLFMGDRLSDIQVMASLDIFANPKLSQQATTAEKSAALEQIQSAYGFYNSIAVFDLKGNPVAQTKGKALDNHLSRGYIQSALKADGAVISQPRISTTSGIFSIYSAAPIKDQQTGQTIGFIRARIPVKVLNQLLQHFTTKGSQYYLLNNQGEVFLGSAGEYVIKTKSDGSAAAKSFDYEAVNAASIFPEASTILAGENLITVKATNTQFNSPQLLAYTPAQAVPGLPQLKWQAILATDTSLVYAPHRRLRLVLILGSVAVAVGVGAIAYALANRLLRPVLLAAKAVQEIGRGNFTTQIDIPGTDEIAQLGADINRMATQLADFVQVQTILAQHSEEIKNIALQLANSTTHQEIFEAVVHGSYRALKAERVVFYQFMPQSAIAMAEAITPGQTTVQNSGLSRELMAEYQAQALPQVEVIANLEQADLTAVKREYLTSLGVKSCLIAPVMVKQQLAGLLMVHQSFTPLPWLDEEVEFITQVVSQIDFAMTRQQLNTQQKLAETREKSAKEVMQMRALSLLQEVADVSQGDLTIRARVTEDEIGTIADSYNSTIESLQNLVTQTKAAAAEVEFNTVTNDSAVQSLAADTVAQTETITNMLQQIESMETSITLVANQANQAEEFVQQATSTIAQEDQVMNRTVAEIKAVQHTVTQTATKAEKLGESSQEISQAVSLIGRFAAQTHLLALKASIEAARAGEQGKGFAVIADEVRSLATQSAEATAEIETLVSKIQLETAEVVDAMHQGAAQIASGSELVQQTRQSLTQVNQVSSEISKLVSSITHTTQQQSMTSAEVSQTIVDVAALAEHNSQSATQVSSSIRELTLIASNLQSHIAKFKT